MSFRNRLRVLWAIVVLAPTIAVVLLIAGAGGSDEEGADLRARQGLRTAFAVHEVQRASARRLVAAVARDPRLRGLLARGPSIELERRANEIVERNPRLVAITVRSVSGEVVVQAGPPTAVAASGLAPTFSGRTRIGAVTASTTTAGRLVSSVRRLTGLHAVIVRDGETLATTIPGLRGRDIEPGTVEVHREEYRAAYGTAAAPAGPPIRLGVLAPTSGAGAGPVDGDRVLALVALVLLAIMLAAAALAFVLLRRRLDQLVAAANRLRAGDHRLRAPVTGGGRLAALGTALNALADELAHKAEEVEQGRDELDDVTRRVGDAFASGFDPDALIDLAVRTAVERCSAEGGRALPVDPDKMRSARVGERSREVTDALAAAERLAFRVSPREGRELMARLRGDARTARGRTAAHETETNGIYALAAALRARVSVGTASEYVGVMSIARRGRSFSESERDLFAYLAAQAGVSIENAFVHERTQRQAVTDELTGLANARRFHEALARELERTRRFSGEVSLVMADIDDFKRINDDHGHQQGDAVLVEVARAMRDQCREVDHVARYGGEEMALILPQTDLPGATELAERVRRAVARRTIRRLDGEGELSVTASFGVAAVPESAADAQSLIAAADGALYRAKRAGKNRVAQAQPSHRSASGDGFGGEARRGANV
jgi:diguanylate cyclase (GGDEF)-like protein